MHTSTVNSLHKLGPEIETGFDERGHVRATLDQVGSIRAKGLGKNLYFCIPVCMYVRIILCMYRCIGFSGLGKLR